MGQFDEQLLLHCPGFTNKEGKLSLRAAGPHRVAISLCTVMRWAASPVWHSFDEEAKVIQLKTSLWLTVDVETIRLLVARAVIAQATLNNVLGLVLLGFFRAPYETPAWVANSLAIPIGWRAQEEPPST